MVIYGIFLQKKLQLSWKIEFLVIVFLLFFLGNAKLSGTLQKFFL